MFGKFRWSIGLMVWLLTVLIVCAVISFNMSEHPKPNETVVVTGYQFIKYAIYILSASMIMGVVRKRTIVLSSEMNWLEAFIALTGAVMFISPFIALLAKFIFQVLKNAYT